MKQYTFIILCVFALMGCNRPSRVEQYRAEKHLQDSIHLIEQQRTLAYYQTQLDSLMPTADSLLALFRYEKNDRYQDHGYYVVNPQKLKIYNYDLRVMVRDDGQDLLVYRNGKRGAAEEFKAQSNNYRKAIECAEHLQIVIRDTKELEKRIARTSLEVQKYEKRLDKNAL